MTDKDTYMYGNYYEYFIKRAFDCERNSDKHGAVTSYLHYLLLADIGKNYLSQPYEKQLLDVKRYLIKAIDKFLIREPTKQEKLHLMEMRLDIQRSNDAPSLVPIIKAGLDNTIRYRDL